MAFELKNIIPGVGLDSIKFGISRHELKELLGEPDEITTEEEGHIIKTKSEIWHYDELEISAGFEEDFGWVLGVLSVTSEFYHLHGKPMVGLNRLEAIRTLHNLGMEDLEFDHVEPDQDMIIALPSNLVLWLDEGVVTEVQWAMIYDEEDLEEED